MITTDPVTRSPVVGSPGYIERLAYLPVSFRATLMPEPESRYNPRAVAVHAASIGKIGYLAPEVARYYFDTVVRRTKRGERVTCPARLAAVERRDHLGIGAEVNLTGVTIGDAD